MRASRLVNFLALVPAVALAQAAVISPRHDGPPGEPAGGVTAAAPDGERTGNALGERYTVQKGDTLWDLSSRFLNNPWYWPKVWSWNPEIANPHWIYPGNVVRFQAAGDGPARVTPGDAVAAAPDEDPDRAADLDDLSLADMKKPQEIGESDDVAVVGPYRIGYVPPKGLFTRRDAFLTRRELAESGVVKAAFEEKLLLAIQDRAYVEFAEPGTVKVGETYLLYKTDRAVTHPVTGELFGYKSSIIGTGKVVAIGDKAATIVITSAYDVIERGSLVGPFAQKPIRQVQRRPNGRELAGYIVAAQQDLISEIGEQHLVFVDKGKADGVEEGNVFTVIRSGDPYGRDPNAVMRDPSLPAEDVGALLVVDAQPQASAAVVIRSLRELYIGDRVEMHAAGTAAATAGSGSD